MVKSINPRHHNRFGSAIPWLILSLLVAAGLLVWVLLASPGKRHKPVVPSLTPPTDADTEAMHNQLAELGDQFGQVLEHQRDAGPLIERIDALIVKYPQSAEAHTLRGQVLIYAGRLDEALDSLERSLKLNPEQANVHLLAGTAASKLDRLEDAARHYAEAVKLQPDVGTNAIFLATIQHKLGRDYEAVPTLLTAIQHDAKLHGAYALLSDIYAEQGKLDLAQAQIKRAIDALNDPDSRVYVIYTLKRAALLRRADQPGESLALLDALPAAEQQRPDVLRDIAESWGMLGKPEMAARRYELALQVDPSNDHAAAEAVRWWLKADDTEAAERNLKALRRINPRHPALPELNAAVSH